MLVVIIGVLFLSVAYYLVKESKDESAHRKEEQKIAEELQKVEKLTPRVESSAFFRELLQEIRSGIELRQENSPIDWLCMNEPCFRISNDRVEFLTWHSSSGDDYDSYTTYWSFDFHEHGYEFLSDAQLYALAKVITNNPDFEFKIIKDDQLYYCEEKKVQYMILKMAGDGYMKHILVGFTKPFIESMRKKSNPKYQHTF